MENISIVIFGKSVQLKSDNFSFMYDKDLYNDEKSKDINCIFNYGGGLQSVFDLESKEHKELEKKLCMFSNFMLQMKLQLEI